MNDRYVRTRILNTLAESGAIANGNVIGTLTNKVQVDGISGRDKVLRALDTLERKDAIRVTRRGKHVIGVYLRPQESCERSDRTDRSPAAKRESMFAKGVPAFLPDSLCSPVVVIKKEDRELVTPNDMPAKVTTSSATTEAPVVTESSTSTKLTTLEELNLAYTGLRCRADPETGLLPLGSVQAFIMEDLKEQGCSLNRATYLNHLLAKLGLRQTKNLGFGPKEEGVRRVSRHQSQVDPDVDTITQEMLDALKGSPKPAEGLDEVQTPVVSDDVLASPESVTAKLVEIIKGLEADKDEQARLTQQEIERLTRALEAAQTRNGELEGEIAALQASAVDPNVTSILERYNKL